MRLDAADRVLAAATGAITQPEMPAEPTKVAPTPEAAEVPTVPQPTTTEEPEN